MPGGLSYHYDLTPAALRLASPLRARLRGLRGEVTLISGAGLGYTERDFVANERVIYLWLNCT